MKSIKRILMDRDDMTEQEAEELIQEAKDAMHEALAYGEMPFDICQDYFGLEPDYIMELM